MRFVKALLMLSGAIVWLALAAWLLLGDEFLREANETRAEVVGTAADRYIASQSAPAPAEGEVKTVAGLHHIPVAVERIRPNIWRAKGVANSYLIATDEGNVLFDGGLATQAAKQKRLLQDAAPGDLKYIILSHSHADHIGATKFWRQEFPGAQIITHQRFAAGQRYLTDLQQYFWNRNRLLYTFMPEAPAEPGSLFAYGGIQADITVTDDAPYRFTLGDREFVVLPSPGAEGDDNLVLWLPEEHALFSGDVFGPLFPMVPNLFTLRGEKFRDPIAYVETLDRLIALQPELILPSHFDPIAGPERLAADLQKMRDATLYIHDQTIAGMNAGKSLWQLMRDIQLPETLNLSQGHGKVSWNVRSIWEYYSTWFHFESTTELYPVPVATIYPELASMIGAEPLAARARTALAMGEPVTALHYVEIALAASQGDGLLLQIRLDALLQLLERAQSTTGNFSEVGWLRSRIEMARQALSDQAAMVQGAAKERVV